MTEATRPPRKSTLSVTLYDSLQDVLVRLRKQAGQAVRLEIPPGSPLFLTAHEFSALLEVSRTRDIDLMIVSDDPLRQRLASVLTIPVEGVEETTSEPSRPSTDIPRGASFTRPSRTAPGAPGPVPTHERLGHTRSALPPLPHDQQEAEPASSPTATAGRGRWTARRGATRSERQSHTVMPGDGAVITDPVEDDRNDVVISPSFGARLSRLGARAIATLVGLVLLAGLLIFAVAFFLLSSATVTLIPETQPLSADLTYAILPPDADAPDDIAVTVPAEPMTLEFTAEATRPTTGTRQEPGEPARGRVRLSNPNTEDVVLEAGTVLESNDGRAYTIDQDVTVPAGDPGLGRYGGAEAAVTAEEGGTAGNIETGELSGRLDSGVYYSNRDAPLTGGTDREIQVADAADIQQLRDEAEAALVEMIQNEVSARVPEDVEIVPESITEEDFRYTFSHQAGDDTKTVSVEAVAPVTLLTYRPEEARRLLTEELIQQLSASAPEGFEFDTDSLVISDASLVGDGGEARYRVTGSGEAVAIIPDTVREELGDELTGDSAESAVDTLREIPNVAEFNIEYAPAWLPDRMPLSENRITVQVQR
ncbi:MAG TPA: baseplate J/gp47 family protein [Thermomicrobiales bacterium]|nr:baseplate J/gp47 family protein [Thermomicrobiales bacterium]